ncbi:hypothetical protein BV22DRAFT_982341, partial [Leucogyrophana mollusca]
VVPVLLVDAFPRPDRGEEELNLFCPSMLLLFKPWHNLEDLKNSKPTWREAYDSYDFPVHLHRILHNMNIENECRDGQDSHSRKVREGNAKPLLY